MNKVRVKYISDEKSIFFEKGNEYEAFVLEQYPSSGLLAFHFSENEMDKEGYYALPADRFEVMQ